METTNTTTARTPRHAWDRPLVYATVGALTIEAVVGTWALLRAFGPGLVRTLEGHPTGEPVWVVVWELLQIAVAISLVVWAVLVARGTRPGWFGAAIVQVVAIVLSGYHVLDTLPDSWGLIAIIMVTTILLATRAVREWCLGWSDNAFELLVADHNTAGDADRLRD